MDFFEIHSKQVFDVHIKGIVHLGWTGESQSSRRKDFLCAVLISVFVNDAGVVGFGATSISNVRRIHVQSRSSSVSKGRDSDSRVIDRYHLGFSASTLLPSALILRLVAASSWRRVHLSLPQTSSY